MLLLVSSFVDLLLASFVPVAVVIVNEDEEDDEDDDEDDESVFERTVERIQKLKIDLPRYSIYTPFPGTPLYKKLLSENRII